MTYSEDELSVIYKVFTPPFPIEVLEDDVQVYLKTDQIIIRVLGSGGSLNRLIKPIWGYESLRSINLGRDWEAWINLKQNVKQGTIPSIRKRRNEDNSYQIDVKLSKSALSRRNLMKVIPIFFNNQTERLSHIDYYHTKLPKNPHYVRRTLKIENPKEHPVLELFTVSSNDSAYIKNMENSSDNNTHLELDTLNNLKLITNTDLNSTLINMDNYYNTKETEDRVDRKIGMLKREHHQNDTQVLNYYMNNAIKRKFEIDFEDNKLVYNGTVEMKRNLRRNLENQENNQQ